MSYLWPTGCGCLCHDEDDGTPCEECWKFHEAVEKFRLETSAECGCSCHLGENPGDVDSIDMPCEGCIAFHDDAERRHKEEHGLPVGYAP